MTAPEVLRPDIDVRSRDWRLLEQWAEHRLIGYRRTLEQYTLDDRMTTHIRGKLAELRAFLALGQPLPEPLDEDAND